MSYEFDYEKEDAIRNISSSNKLREYITKYGNGLNNYQWLLIVRNPHFSLKLIENDEFLERLDWEAVCCFMKLSQAELKKYHDYLNWYCVSCFQTLTTEYIKEHKDELSLDRLIKNESLDKKTADYAQKIYNENNNPKHYKIWRDNLFNAPTFRMSISSLVKTPTKYNSKLPELSDIEFMQKDEIKPYLDKLGIRYLYKNTIAELRKMLSDAKLKEIKDAKKKNISTEARYKEALYNIILKENSRIDIEKQHDNIKPKSQQNKKLDYSKLTKAELKKILDSRKVKYLYKDTIDILRQKCIDSERRQ